MQNANENDKDEIHWNETRGRLHHELHEPVSRPRADVTLHVLFARHIVASALDQCLNARRTTASALDQ